MKLIRFSITVPEIHIALSTNTVTRTERRSDARVSVTFDLDAASCDGPRLKAIS